MLVVGVSCRRRAFLDFHMVHAKHGWRKFGHPHTYRTTLENIPQYLAIIGYLFFWPDRSTLEVAQLTLAIPYTVEKHAQPKEAPNQLETGDISGAGVQPLSLTNSPK